MNDNIRVAIRVRPLIARETEKSDCILWQVEDSKCISQVSSSDKFGFDRVFDKEEDNYDVYNDLCLPIVKSIMQGFNGTIFAYGQTSSGKTFTMMGQHNGIHKGVIHYSISDIFNIIQEMPEREFLLRVSFLEIYNEKVYDLLSDKNEDLKLLEDSYGFIKVNGLQEKIVQTEDQIWQLMRKGQRKRRTGETQMNSVSSRSHSIFRMILESRMKGEEDAVVNVSQLNLVDLAGSENFKQTKTKGDRFKEGIHINLSLSTLVQVISQLSEKQDQFINYRNSKLTRLLQNSLGGNALTAIICTVTPASLKETLSTLNFASRAKKIKNKPEINEILTDQALLKQYANKIKKLSQELQVTKEQGKELEEKTKQNENLKRQIEALKANFVSQTDINKAARRETWGGHLDARRMQLDFLSSRSKIPSYPDYLPTLEEEPECDSEQSDFSVNMTIKQRGSSSFFLPPSIPKNVSNAKIQTEPESESLEQNSKIDYEGTMIMVSEMKKKLTTLQNELSELSEYTNLEQQYLRAESELQREIEVLKNENRTLKKIVESTSCALCSETNSSLSNECEPKEISIYEELNSKQNKVLLSTKKYISGETIGDKINCTDSTLLDESLKSNFLALYDECIESEAIADLKTEIESLKYDMDLKDKQISLLNDKIHIKEQMIMSFKDEIALSKTINSPLNSSVIALEKVSHVHGSCQTDGTFCSPRNNLIPKESQTSPFKPVNVYCCECGKLNNVKGPNETPVKLNKSSNFDLIADKYAQTSPEILSLNVSDLAEKESVPEKLFISRGTTADIHLRNNEMIDAYTEVTPSKVLNDVKSIMQNQLTQITPVKSKEFGSQYCTNIILNECCTQTSPINSFLTQTCGNEVSNTCELEGFCTNENFLKDSTVDSKTVKSVTLQSYSTEMEILINKINELCVYTLEFMKNCVEADYLKDIDVSLSCIDDCSSKSAEKQVIALRDLIMILEFCIKNKVASLELLNNQLESKFEEVISLNLKLSASEIDLNKKETEFSTECKYLQEKISELEKCNRDLKQRINCLETYHSEEVDSLKAKFETGKSEWNTKTLLTVEDLEAKYHQELAEIKIDLIQKEAELNYYRKNNTQLQETIGELEQLNRNLKQKINYLETSHSEEIETFETKFENAKSDWSAKTSTLIKDLEAKYDQELNDQENKITGDFHAKILELKEAHMRENYELKEEIIKMKSLHDKELMHIKEHFQKQIKDLEDQLFSEHSEKENLKSELEIDKEREIMSFRAKCEEKFVHYRSKQRQCKEINSQLKSQIIHYIEEIKQIKKEKSGNSDLSCQHLEEKLNELTNEKDILLKEYKAAKQQISELKDGMKRKIKKISDLEGLLKNAYNSNKEIEEMNKKLLYDLDQKKAKIMSLETNNTNMMKEVKKLREMHLTKSTLPCKYKIDTKEIKAENAAKFENCNDNMKKEEFDQRSNPEIIPEKHTPKPESLEDGEFQRECNNPTKDNDEQEKILMVGGGSGPANVVKCYWLEGLVHEKDKEVARLKKELSGLNSELKAMKIHPVIEEQKPEVKKPENVKTLASPHQGIDDDITIRNKAICPYPQGAVPKLHGKGILNERNRRNSCKPYEQPPKTLRNQDDEYKQLDKMKENRQGPKTRSDTLKVLTDGECKTQ